MHFVMNTLLLISTLVLVLAGCDGNSKLKSMPDYELAEKYGECLDKKPTAPGYATACENFRKECERRRQELSSFVCRTY